MGGGSQSCEAGRVAAHRSREQGRTTARGGATQVRRVLPGPLTRLSAHPSLSSPASSSLSLPPFSPRPSPSYLLISFPFSNSPCFLSSESLSVFSFTILPLFLAPFFKVSPSLSRLSLLPLLLPFVLSPPSLVSSPVSVQRGLVSSPLRLSPRLSEAVAYLSACPLVLFLAPDSLSRVAAAQTQVSKEQVGSLAYFRGYSSSYRYWKHRGKAQAQISLMTLTQRSMVAHPRSSS